MVSKFTVCYHKERETKTYPFPFLRSYLDSVDFCHLLSGELAIAHDNATAMGMLKICESHFAGFNDIES